MGLGFGACGVGFTGFGVHRVWGVCRGAEDLSAADFKSLGSKKVYSY